MVDFAVFHEPLVTAVHHSRRGNRGQHRAKHSPELVQLHIPLRTNLMLMDQCPQGIFQTGARVLQLPKPSHIRKHQRSAFLLSVEGDRLGDRRLATDLSHQRYLLARLTMNALCTSVKFDAITP